MPQFFIACALVGVLLGADRSSGMDIAGKVDQVEGSSFTIATDSEYRPRPGDTLEVYFKIPGLDEKARVATGTVDKVVGEQITAKAARITGKLAKGQSVDIHSERPRRRDEPEGEPPRVPASTPSSGSESLAGALVDFNRFPAGPLAADALASYGISRIETATGAVQIVEGSREMLVPPGHRRVLMLTGTGLQTSLRLQFGSPISRLNLTRIATTGGASLPKWRLQAFDAAGRVVDSTGEDNFAVNAPPRPFAVKGEGITQVLLTTDNRLSDNQAWATYSALPLVGLSIQWIERGSTRMPPDIPAGIVIPPPPPLQQQPPATTGLFTVLGQVKDVRGGTATVAIEGGVMPKPGDHANFVRPLDTPDQKIRMVGQGSVTEVLGGEVLIRLQAGSDVVPGDQMRVTVVR